MRSLRTMALMAVVLAFTAGAARAQFPGFGGGGGIGQLLTNKSVQDELKLDADQIEKATAAIKKVAEDNKELVAKARDRQTSREERAEVMKKLNDLNMAAVKDVMKPEQLARMKQIQLHISMQFGGPAVFNDPTVVDALKLNDEQKADVKAIADDTQKEVRALFGGGFSEESLKKMAAIQKEGVERAAKVLTKDQKKAWDELVGKPFEFKMEFPRPPQ